jgi:hypothetical protein
MKLRKQFAIERIRGFETIVKQLLAVFVARQGSNDQCVRAVLWCGRSMREVRIRCGAAKKMIRLHTPKYGTWASR